MMRLHKILLFSLQAAGLHDLAKQYGRRLHDKQLNKYYSQIPYRMRF